MYMYVYICKCMNKYMFKYIYIYIILDLACIMTWMRFDLDESCCHTCHIYT